MAISPSFIFDTSKGETPQTIAMKRALAAQIMGGFGNRPARNVGEGIGNAFASLGQGITANVMNRRASAGEAAGQAQAGDLRSQLISAISGNQFPAAPSGGQGAVTPPSMPQTAEAAEIRQGLVQRGLPEHVADAFVLNMQDESGLNPGINERNPIVPGSRGGFGLYQLTGPRRRAYEQFAAQRGVDPSDTGAQLDFLMTELQGPEAKAAQSILSAPDTGTAAAAIVNDFLRPAEQHRNSRANRYMALAGQGGRAPASQTLEALAGGQPAQVASLDPSIGMGQPETAPEMGVQMAQAGEPDLSQIPVMAGGNAGVVQPGQQSAMDPALLMQVLGNPFMDEGTKAYAQAMLQQQMQAQDPMRALDMDYKRAQIGALNAKASGLADPAKVQSSTILDDGTSVLVMNDGKRRVLGPSGEEVTGQAAADAIRSARDYGVENQRAVYGGRREGTLGADIEYGGAAKSAEKIGEASVKAGMDAWTDYGKLQSSLGNIDEAISALDQGAKSGLVYKMLPNVTEASASLENAMNRMGLDVIGSVTFGALSEGEMRLAMDTAVPRDLGPEDNDCQ